jgi:hypothetical protein
MLTINRRIHEGPIGRAADAHVVGCLYDVAGAQVGTGTVADRHSICGELRVEPVTARSDDITEHEDAKVRDERRRDHRD